MVEEEELLARHSVNTRAAQPANAAVLFAHLENFELERLRGGVSAIGLVEELAPADEGVDVGDPRP
jgi:hypothetical protein